jgi:hypothetical protein
MSPKQHINVWELRVGPCGEAAHRGGREGQTNYYSPWIQYVPARMYGQDNIQQDGGPTNLRQSSIVYRNLLPLLLSAILREQACDFGKHFVVFAIGLIIGSLLWGARAGVASPSHFRLFARSYACSWGGTSRETTLTMSRGFWMAGLLRPPESRSRAWWAIPTLEIIDLPSHFAHLRWPHSYEKAYGSGQLVCGL